MLAVISIWYLATNYFVGNGNWDYHFDGPFTHRECVQLQRENSICIKLPKEKH